MSRGIHWFQNDLRLRDNSALDQLATRAEQWLPVFVLDPRLARPDAAARTHFLIGALERLDRDLERRGVRLHVLEGHPEKEIPRLLTELNASLLSFNASATPFARQRDAAVQRAAEKAGVEVLRARDDVVFAADEIRTQKGDAYSVYTPYKNAWWKRWHEAPRLPRRMHSLPDAIPGFKKGPGAPLGAMRKRLPELEDVDLPTPGEDAGERRLQSFLEDGIGRYHKDRDTPALDGTSRLSPYLRFGAISIRHAFARAAEAAAEDASLRRGVEKWSDELVWREFYAAILEEHPRVSRGNHRQEYDALVWNDDAEGFEAWCEGRTGFPIVDAGMRQLRQTGWMHNRVRMIVASFLTKDLLIDWREGERFFFQQLVDGDPASNNGGWQWAASTGSDAQPYFRIFNPTRQGERWDPDGEYVQRWVPELSALPGGSVHDPWKAGDGALDYPRPIVDHAERRELALERYREARESGSK